MRLPYQYVVLQDAVGETAAGAELVTTDGIEGGYRTVTFQVTGTFTATVDFECTVDGSTWVPLEVTDVGDSTTPADSTAAAGIFRATVTGLKAVRANVSAYTDGAVTVEAIAVV